MPDIVRDSDLIENLEQAQKLFAEDLAGKRKITCHKQPVTVVFERDATHFYSESTYDETLLGPTDRVVRQVPAGNRIRTEIRAFSLYRARLMSYILPAISDFTVSVPDSGGRTNHAKSVLYGPTLPNGTDHMRVILRPGPGDAWTCVSAYPVSHEQWLSAMKLKRAKFPP